MAQNSELVAELEETKTLIETVKADGLKKCLKTHADSLEGKIKEAEVIFLKKRGRKRESEKERMFFVFEILTYTSSTES